MFPFQEMVFLTFSLCYHMYTSLGCTPLSTLFLIHTDGLLREIKKSQRLGIEFSEITHPVLFADDFVGIAESKSKITHPVLFADDFVEIAEFKSKLSPSPNNSLF